jgi:hypothetical protein
MHFEPIKSAVILKKELFYGLNASIISDPCAGGRFAQQMA